MVELDAGPDLPTRLAEIRPDVVFNALHGRWGEDGCVQGILEWMGIPYTHSGVLASSLAMDKARSKDVYRAAGLPIVESVLASRDEVRTRHVMPAPYVVKPNNEGSSVGVYLVMDGASPQEIDSALEDFGFAMGPFAVADLAGLDIGMMTRKRLAPTRDPRERYVPIADRICERGWFGRKTGQGYYLYGDREGPNPAVAGIIEEERAEAGITPREITDDEIVERYMTAMIAEGARVLEDGIAQRPVDIDAVFLFGYGFPRFRGGPMFYADTIGAAELVRRIETYAEDDAFFWRVPPLLARMAADGTTFADLDERA